jgi:serine/threonine protein kinase/Tfp pilus assembly protein PilF
MAESSSERNPLDVLAEEFLDRYRAGERPALSEFIERHPELACEIRELFPTLIEVEFLKPGDQTSDFSPRADADSSHPAQIGEFRILREVGRGGMGVVYEALQETLGRHVALKVLPAGALADPRRAERFRREARAAAKLHHTNIVPVFGTGEANGLHYYAMQFIAGQGLDRVIDELRRQRKESASTGLDLNRTTDDPVTMPASAPSITSSAVLSHSSESAILSASGRRYWESVARLGVQAASALAHAHDQGVLHRDIKPSNLLLDPHGTVWVTDFGLAKMSEDEDLTAAGDIVGTLRYMSPERFEGRCDARADIYALGLTLYEMLTLRPAFDESGREQLVAQVMKGTPPRPTQVGRDVPRDLETIVLKALAREPEARYATAGEMADDLQRFVEDRPIQARRASALERLRRWSRRNPMVASLTAILAVLLIGGATAATIAALSFSALANEERAAREKLDRDMKNLHLANGLLESGFRYAVRKDWPRALADYSSAIELRPEHSQVWSDRALLYLRLGLAEEAAADFVELFKVRKPNEPAWWYFHAALRLHVGDAAGYRKVCKEMREQFVEPSGPEVVRALVQTCALAPGGIDDPKELVQIVKEAEQRFPTDSFAAQRVAACFRAGQDREVTALTVPVDPKKVAAARPADLCFRSMSLARLGEPAAASTALAAAGEKLDATASVLSLQSFGPKSADLFVGSFPAAQTEEALADWIVSDLLYREASGEKSKHPLPQFIRARGCAALGWWDRADESTEQAMRICFANEKTPLLPEIALVERSRLNALRGQWTAVAQDIDRAGKLARPQYQLQSVVARLYSAHGHDSDARKHLASAVAEAPSDLNLWLERGRASIRLTDWNAAASELSIVLDDERFQPPPSNVGWSGFYSRYFPEGGVENDAKMQAALDIRKQVREEIVRQDELYTRLQASRPHDENLLLERGRYLLNERRFRAAIDHYIGHVKKQDSPPMRNHILFRISLDVAAFDEVFDALIRRWPDHVGLWNQRARWHFKSGDVDKSADDILHTLPAKIVEPVDPDPNREMIYSGLLLEQDRLFQLVAARRSGDADLWMARFRERAKRNDWENAAKAAHEVVKRRPGNLATLTLLATTLSATPRAELAADYFQLALKLKPNELALLRDLFGVNLRLKRWDAANEVLDTGLQNLGNPAATKFTKWDFYNTLSYQPMMLEELCRRRPRDGTLWLVRGRFHSYLKKWDDALRAFQTASTLLGSLDVGAGWAQAAVNLKNWDAVAEALEYSRRQPATGWPGLTIDNVYNILPDDPAAFAEMIRRRPRDEVLWFHKGDREEFQQKWNEALGSFATVLEIAPKHVEGWRRRGRAHAYLGQWKEAAAAYNTALNHSPPVPVIDPKPTQGPQQQSLHSEILVRTFQWPQGKQLYDEVARLRPGDARLCLEYCRALNSYTYGTVPPALRAELPAALDELVKRGAKEPGAWLERARYRVRQGDFDKATEDYVTAAELLPKMPPLDSLAPQLYADLVSSPRLFDKFTLKRTNDPFPWSRRANQCSQDPTSPHFLTWEADIKRAIAIRPDEATFQTELRQLLLEFGLWDRAAIEYDAEMKRQEPAPGDILWVEAAAAFAVAEKTKQYQALCRRMAEVWNKLDSPQSGQQLAWTAALLPDSGVNLESMLTLAQAARKADSRQLCNTATVALVQHRLGQSEKVLLLFQDYFREFGRHYPPAGEQVVMEMLRILAIARTGKMDDAQVNNYRGLSRQVDNAITVGGARRRAAPGHAWAAVAILRREIEAVLKEKP